MCNCSKQIRQTDCDRLKKFNADPLKRFFIYHISDEKGLLIAYVPNGSNPNDIALARGFTDDEGNAEWYSTKEHPCLQE